MSAIKSSKEQIHLDDVLSKFSISGRYYVSFMFMMILLNMNDIISCSSYVFSAEKVKYWCADERFRNNSCASLSISTEVCTEWVYEDPYSFVAEFQLACQEWKRTLVGTAQGLGYGVGLLIIGPLSDRFGRKTLIVWTAVIGGLIGVVKSFSNNYWVFVILELLGTGVGNSYSPAFILTMEITAHEKRVLASTIIATTSNMAYLILPLTAWFFSYWRHFLLVLYGPTIIFVSYIFLLDESPRWLLRSGEKDKAIEILKKTAKTNKVNLDVNTLDNLSFGKNEEVTLRKTVKDTLSSGVLVKRFFLCILLWTFAVFVNYGARINAVLLPGNKYVNFGLVGIVSVLGKLLPYWILRRFTRRTTMISILFLTTIFFFVQPFVPENLQWLSLLLFMAGKFLVVAVFIVIYIFTSELFPTYTRNSTHALCSSIGRIGSILAPQTPLLMVYWHGLPSLTFGAASLMAGAVALLLPRATDGALPDTVQQAEVVGHKPTTDTHDSGTVIMKPNTPTSGNMLRDSDMPVYTVEMTTNRDKEI